MNVLTFENLPQAVTELNQKSDWIISAIHQLIDTRPKVNERLTAPQAADYLNIALPTLYAYTSQKAIKHYKAGKKLSFLKSDLDEYMNEGRRKTADEMAADMLTKRRGVKA